MTELLEEENEGMDDKEEELGLNVQWDFCVNEEESAEGDYSMNGFCRVPTRTEGADNCACGKGENGDVIIVKEVVGL
ncbi:uncharacterized protein MONOS_13070 [Monocercomonoides exilis]|uniref:uncharacterized protein n=1 Tax=Monocercomonoides exilis TaxID=2049356 RepID=UPI003559E2FA|nr:hypothetical protein MONOS_13070 [Monocercomonoides exilis]|eukprot:MONOS_13070.1-p1 / transcript=MONOS_13070.1 / gene=MONOS_13070 / organism=Monocercomonoides_exilis_PA203 / gene_product=unspecified product / transcript_product=unspecified product / location=Mono_scaffold00774:15890-16120(+) / protein_length=77 / sequence_SO=supercontig / SO=protein_coding / is_pseudo=false